MIQWSGGKQLKKFLLINLFIALLIFIVYLLLLKFLPPDSLSPATPYIILLFVLSNVFIFLFRTRYEKSGDRKFINLYLLVNSIKTLIFLGIILTYAFLRKDDAINFSLSFLVNYVIFTLVLVKYQTRLKHL